MKNNRISNTDCVNYCNVLMKNKKGKSLYENTNKT